MPLDIFEAAERGKITLVQKKLDALSRKKLYIANQNAKTTEKEALLPPDFKAYTEPSGTVLPDTLQTKEQTTKLATSWGSAEDNLRGSGNGPEMFKLQEIITDLNGVIERQLLVARRRALAESDSHGRTALVSHS